MTSFFRILAFFLISTPLAAQGLEFQSISETPTVTFDAPSQKARKLFILNKYYPVEVVVSLPLWVKIRDASGDLSWVEKKSLSTKRYVMVSVPTAEIKKDIAPNAPTLAQAEQNVVFELIETLPSGWVKVRYADGRNGQNGQIGYIRTPQVWGA